MLHCDKKRGKEDDSNETTGTCTLVFRYHHVRRRESHLPLCESFISIHQPSCCKNYAFSVASFLRTLSVSATTKSTPISPHSIITPTHTHTKTQQQKALIRSKETHMIAPAWRIVLRKHAREHVNTRKLFCCLRKAPEDCFADPRATRSASPLLEPSSRRGSHSVLLLSATATDERYALHLRSSSFGSNYLNFELVVMRAHLQQHTRMNKHTATSDFCHNR